VLDAAPNIAIPAVISYVADVAQFTPRSVETQSEREKLMFRVKAQIPVSLLNQHIERVKTGLPGVVWVKLNEEANWPENLPELIEFIER
jgi:HlyD family secretion protein